MGTDFRYRSGDQAAPQNVSAVALLLGTCLSGTVGNSYGFNPGDDVQGTLGPGKATALALGMAGIGPCAVAPVAPTYPALPAVTHLDATGGNSPTGPAITIAAANAGAGALDDAPDWTLRVTSDGARMDCLYDGTSTAETFVIPACTPGAITGTAPITPTTLGLANGLTLVFDAPAGKTLTFPAGSLVAAGAGLMAATATIMSTHTYHASDLLSAGVAAILAAPRKVSFTTAGATPSHVPATIVVTGTDYSGASQTETVVPDTSAGSVSTTKVYATITSLVYASAGGTDATIAVGYEDAYATADELAAAVVALAAAAPLAITGSVVQTSTSKLLGLATTATGPSATVTLDSSPGTAPAVLGLTASETGTGANGSRTFPWLGVVVSFPAGPYTALETYEIPVQGPRGAVSDYVAALEAAIASYTAVPFGYVAVVEDPSSNANARALYDALAAVQSASQHSADAPVLFDVLVPTALHVPSAAAATNRANITTFEGSLSTALSGAQTTLGSIVVDDCYTPGPGPMPGTFRRPAIWGGVYRRSSLDRIAGNPCDGAAPLVGLVAADGVTLARADGQNGAVKLAGLGGAGFWCLKRTADGGTKFAPSATRAGSTDRYRNPGVVAIALAMSRAILPQLQAWEGTWGTDPANPKAADPNLLMQRSGVLTALINPVAFPDASPPNVANFTETITAPTILDDGIFSVAIAFNPLAVGETCIVTVTATGVSLQNTASP